MPEPLFLLMVRVGDQVPETKWAAIDLAGYGRKLTREQAESVAPYVTEPARFLLTYTESRARFADPERPRTLMIAPPDTIWTYGELLLCDLMAVLKNAAGRPRSDAAAWPDRDKLPIPVAAVTEVAGERFGRGHAHDIETQFDRVVADLGGFRHGEPACYHVPLDVLGAIQAA